MEDKEIQHAIAKHADSKLLLGQADRGALRAANPDAFKKFQAATKTVAVTREVLDMLHCCQDELRQAQSDYKESKLLPSQSPPDSKQQQQQQQAGGAAPAKSAKARQNEAVSAADAAATYSLRSVERGRVDPTPTATPQQLQKPTASAVPADWGFLKNVGRLQAAPAAAAAKLSPAALPRPEQPYLSADAATKATHQAWQPEEAATWRKVLTAKKTRQANKSQIEEAERERAASFIQARWMLRQHQKQQQQLKEQQLTSWAEQHYAAAAARMSITPEASTKQLSPAAADPDSDDDESTSTASSAEQQQQQQQEEVEARRRSRTRVAPEAAARPAKPAVQPWSRMVGREAPINTTTSTTKWRGAAAGAMAASKLAALAAAAGDEGGLQSPRAAAADATGSGPEEEPPALLMQEVAPMTSGYGTAAGGLSRMSSSVPLGVKVARTSSTAAALAHKGSTLLSNLTSLFRTKSSTGGTDGAGPAAAPGSAGSSSSGSRGSSSAGGVQGGAPAGVSLTKRLSMDIAAFFTGHGTHKAKDSSAASKPASTHMASRGSLDLGGSLVRSGGSSGASRDSNDEAAAAGGKGPPLAPTPPTRRSSVEFVRSLFRRSSLDLPAPAPDITATAAAAAAAAAAAGAAGAVRGGGGDRTAPCSRFITAESCGPSQLTSPLLSGCATARTSWTDTDKDEPAAAGAAAAAGAGAGAAAGGGASPDLAALGAAAAAAYLDAASRALASREAVMSLCGGIPPQGLSAEQQAGALQGRSTGREDFSLSGGMAGACRSSVVFAAGAAGAVSSAADREEAAADGFESIWSKITTASAGGNGSSSNRGAAAAGQQQQQQQQQSHEPKQGLQASPTSEQPQGQPHTQQQADTLQAVQPSVGALTASSSSRSNSRQTELLQPGKPKVVGQGEVGFQPNKPVLLTAADITSSSFYKQSGTASSKAPATSKAPTVVDASSSSLYKSTAHPHQAPPEQDGAPATAVGPAVAASSSLYASGNQRGASPASVTIGDCLLPTAATSPSASPGTSSPQSPASPMHQQQRVWSPKAPQPPRAPSGSSSSRPGPRPQMFARQGGLKSIDLAADVAAALARSGAAAEDTTTLPARTPAAPAPASPLETAAKGPPARPPSAGMSSVSQKLAIARRMAATAAADADESSSPTTLSLQLDGSKSNVSRKSIAQPDQVLVKLTGPSGSSSSSPPPASIAPAFSSRKAVDFAPLRPTAAAAAGRPGVAWAPESSIRMGPWGGSGDLNTHVTANFLGGRGSPEPSAHPQAIGAPAGKSAKGGSAAGSGLPNLAGHRRDGSDSPVSANAFSGKGPKLAAGRNAGGSAVLGIAKDNEGTKPRRNSYSNDGSNPNSAGDSGRGGLAVAGGKLRPTSGAKSGDQPDHLKRLSLL